MLVYMVYVIVTVIVRYVQIWSYFINMTGRVLCIDVLHDLGIIDLGLAILRW